VGGWVTAVVARRADLRDVWILAGLQSAMTLAANVMLFDRRLLWFYGLGLLLTPKPSWRADGFEPHAEPG
jgi:hypothetical protein